MKNILRNSNYGFTRWGVALALTLALTAATGWGQYSLTNTNYTQSFDGLGTGTSTVTGGNLNNVNTNLNGWYFLETGSSANTAITAGNGSSNIGDTYNLGTNAASNRTLGQLQSGNVATSFGFYFSNSLGASITNLIITYKGETWRVGTTNRSDSMTFAYNSTATALNSSGTWTAAALGFTNNSAGATASGSLLQTVNVSNNIAGTITNGGTLFLRWTDVDVTGSDDAIGINDFTLTAQTQATIAPTVPTVPTITGITPGDGSLSVTFTPPASDGGFEITNYKYSTNAGITWSAVSPAATTSPILISGLNNGTKYNVQIRAMNEVGDGLATASTPGTPSVPPVYKHDFGTAAISTKPYTGTPVILNSQLSNSSWTTSATAFTSYNGSAGLALSLSSTGGSPTYTLTFDVAPGYQLDVMGLSYWRQRSNTGSTGISIAINGGPAVYSENAVPTSGSNVGSQAVTGKTGLTGTVTVVLTMTGGASSQTFRLDDFTLEGTVTSISQTPPTITSTNAFSGTVGVEFSNNITATGYAPITFSGTNLPGGLSVATNGVISGTPTATGPFNATLTASNSVGSTNQAATFTIAKATPRITVAPTASAITAGQALSNSIISDGTMNPVGGIWAWSAPATVVIAGTNSYAAVYTPASSNQANWSSLTSNLTVVVNPAAPTESSFFGWLGSNAPSAELLLQYAYGAVSPSNTVNWSNLPSSGVSGGNLVLTYYVRDKATNLSLVIPQLSSDLANTNSWSTNGITQANLETNSVDGVNVVKKTAAVTIDSTNRKFLRLRISE